MNYLVASHSSECLSSWLWKQLCGMSNEPASLPEGPVAPGAVPSRVDTREIANKWVPVPVSDTDSARDLLHPR